MVTCDHAAGPQPVAVLDRLAALGERVVLVRGNADRELVALAQGHASTVGQAYEVGLWAASQLSTEHVELLAGLPHPITVNIEGFGPVVFCHGTPRDDEEVVLVDTCLQRWAEVLADLPEGLRTVVCGHTPHALRAPGGPAPGHQPRQHRHALRAAAGRAGGSWALLRAGAVTLPQTDLDVEASIAAVVARSTYPDRQAWVEDYLPATASDAEALTNFAPRDGRSAR